MKKKGSLIKGMIIKKSIKRFVKAAMALAMVLVIGFVSNVNVEAAKVTKSVAGQITPTYKLYVNRAANCVTAYTKDANGEYTIPVRAFVCSTGKTLGATPAGTFKTSDYYDWRLMVDGTYAQYAVRFNGPILFHSVPYIARDKSSLEWDQYNLLGQPASLGCVRLSTMDAKWIYDNCQKGTEVVVYDDATNPGPLGKPLHSFIAEANPAKGWDPADLVAENPWNTLRPTIHLTKDMGDGVLYVPVGATLDDVKKAIGVTAFNGVEYTQSQFQLFVNGNFDLNTFGAYNVVIQTLDISGICESKEMIMAVVYM